MTDVLNDLFHPQVKTETEQQNVTEFKPSAKKGKAGVYTAVIRFIPNPTDPSGKSIIQKYTTTIQNPLTNSWRTIDNPSTVGNPDPIVDTFFKLRNSKNATDNEKAKNFSRRKSYASLIQVIKCESEPQLENKILVWRYGQKIYEKLVNEMNPPIGDPRNPFDPIHGHLFNVKVQEKSGFNNYDQSMFIDAGEQNGMRIIVNDQVHVVTDKLAANEKGRQLVLNYLNDNCPDMTPYEFHPWDEETTKFVDQMIQFYTSSGVTNQDVPQASASFTEMLTQQNSAPVQATPGNTAGLQLGLENITPTQSSDNTVDTGIDTSELDAILNSNSPATSSVGGSEDTTGLGTLDDILNGNML